MQACDGVQRRRHQDGVDVVGDASVSEAFFAVAPLARRFARLQRDEVLVRYLLRKRTGCGSRRRAWRICTPSGWW